MSAFRGKVITTHADGHRTVFDPIIRYQFNSWLWQIGIRGDYDIGLMRGYTIGSYSIYKTRFWQFGKWTLYLHLGIKGPHNPRRAGE